MNQAENIQQGKKREQRSSSAVERSTMVYGRVPPQAKDIENAVLGIILQHSQAIDVVASIVSAESFYVEANQRIFRTVMDMANRNQVINILTVIEELKKREELEIIGGPHYLTTLDKYVTSSAGLEKYCQIIQQKFIQREMIRIAGEIIGDAYEDSTDAFELLDYAEEKFLAIGTNNMQGDTISIDRVVKKALARIETNRLNDTPITGVPSGFRTLDAATKGWQPGFIVMAARPSIGKSALALALARNAAQNEIKSVPVAVWSLEMEDVQNVLRMLSAESEIKLYSIQTGRLDDEQMKKLYQVGSKLSQQKIFFDDSPGTNIISFRSKARRLKKKHNIGLIILDYLQLLGGDGEKGNREQEIARISRSLKNLSRELQIPIIALSQMSRDIEKRTGKNRKPQLSDIRESGAIEQDADVVIFLWGPEEDEIEQDRSLLNRRYARIAKQRDGVLLTVELEFETSTQKITEYQPAPEPPKELGEGKWKAVPKTGDLFENKP
jgi:replicative DNA helicase